MDTQIQQLIELQAEQNQLLRKYLWRIRFSLLTLLLLTTAICCGLGVVIYYQRMAQRPASSTITFQTGTAGLTSPQFFDTGTVELTPVEIKGKPDAETKLRGE